MIRKGAKKVRVENSGLVVFLYDDAFKKELAGRKPSIVTGLSGSSEDEALAALAGEGKLLCYELAQDDAIQAEVVVGEPLTSDELARAPRLAPQTGRLALPSGKLRVEGYDSLRIGPEAPVEKGVGVKVEPGDYEVAIHRLDLAALDGKTSDAPGEVIVLTPRGDRKAKPLPGLLRHPGGPRPIAAATAGGVVVDGVFRGRTVDAIGSHGSVQTDLTRAAAAKLGLVRGARLEVQLGPLAGTAFFLGGLELYGRWIAAVLGPDALDAHRARDPRLLCAWFESTLVGKEKLDLLRFGVPGIRVGLLDAMTESPDLAAAGFQNPGPGVPVTCRVGAPPFEPPPATPALDAWEVADGRLSAPVLAATASRIVLGAGPEALEALGAREGAALELQVGATKRRLFLGRGDLDAMYAIKGEPAPKDRARVAELKARATKLREEGNALRAASAPAAQRTENQRAQLAVQRELQRIDVPAELIERMGLAASFLPHWDASDGEALFAQAQLRPDADLPLGLAVAPGTRATLRLA